VVASAGWLPGADLVGDAVDEQIELFGRQAGHRLGVQQSLQSDVRTVRMAAGVYWQGLLHSNS